MTTRRERDDARKEALINGGAFDISALDTRGLGECTITDFQGNPLRFPNGDGQMQEVTITVYSADSETYARAQEEVAEKHRSNAARRNRQPSYKELQDDTREVVVRCTHSWHGIAWPDEKGTLITRECNLKHIRELYTRAPVIYDQVRTFVHDRINFTRLSPNPSLPTESESSN